MTTSRYISICATRIPTHCKYRGKVLYCTVCRAILANAPLFCYRTTLCCATCLPCVIAWCRKEGRKCPALLYRVITWRGPSPKGSRLQGFVFPRFLLLLSHLNIRTVVHIDTLTRITSGPLFRKQKITNRYLQHAKLLFL